jgi:hypothetical protein
MEVFILPHTAIVYKVVPKNTFDSYTNARQKRLFTNLIARITWYYKLSPETINLESKDIKEIQIFRVELKAKEEVKQVLDIIDKAIPYHIIFVVEHEGQVYLSTSPKHPNPLNEHNSVIDWNFKTAWFNPSHNKYKLELKKSIDAVYHAFCKQLSSRPHLQHKSFTDLIEYNKNVETLKGEIKTLKSNLGKCRQFNHKVELNIKLKETEKRLQTLMSDT